MKALKMLGYFLVWSAKGLGNKIAGMFSGVLRIHEILLEHVRYTVRTFREDRFVIGFMNFVLSLMMTFGFCTFLGGVVYYGEIDTHQTEITTWLTYALGIDVLFYFSCFIVAMYQKFLEDYNRPWELLKEKNEE